MVVDDQINIHDSIALALRHENIEVVCATVVQLSTDGRLDALLNIYGLKRESFYERVRIFKDKIAPKVELQFLAENITDDQAQLVLSFTKTIMQQQ